jgi:hypothetical protein
MEGERKPGRNIATGLGTGMVVEALGKSLGV